MKTTAMFLLMMFMVGCVEQPLPGELLGPCPVNDWGEVDLCYSESLACVPADGAQANICLGLGSCNGYTDYKHYGIGWGDACMPMCRSDNDCMDGQVCVASLADGTLMCAWPI